MSKSAAAMEFNVEDIREMDPIDIIDRSMVSKEFCKSLKAHKPLKANITWRLDTDCQYSNRFIPAVLPKGTHRRGDRIFTFDERLNLKIDFPDYGKTVLFYFMRQGDTVGETSVKTLSYGDPIKMEREDNAFMVVGRPNMEILTRDRHDLLVLECISKHMLEIVDVQNFNLRYGFLWDFKLEQSFIFKLAKHFESLNVKSRYDDQVVKKDLRKLLKNATAKNMELCITVEPTRGVQRPLIFDCESLTISMGDWVKVNDLLGATCKVMHVDGMQMSMEEAGRIVKEWMSGARFGNLESMDLYVKDEFEDIEKEMDKIEGVKKATAAAKRMNAQRVIKRATDGKIAFLWCSPRLLGLEIQ